MVEIARLGDGNSPIRRRALAQAARELLLAQSSDWAFIMKTATAVDYAVRRTREHIAHFIKLYHDILHDTIDIDWLSKLENKDNIFPELDYRIYAEGDKVARSSGDLAIGKK